jgi:hypothetical protein
MGFSKEDFIANVKGIDLLKERLGGRLGNQNVLNNQAVFLSIPGGSTPMRNYYQLSS